MTDEPVDPEELHIQQIQTHVADDLMIQPVTIHGRAAILFHFLDGGERFPPILCTALPEAIELGIKKAVEEANRISTVESAARNDLGEPKPVEPLKRDKCRCGVSIFGEQAEKGYCKSCGPWLTSVKTDQTPEAYQ